MPGSEPRGRSPVPVDPAQQAVELVIDLEEEPSRRDVAEEVRLVDAPARRARVRPYRARQRRDVIRPGRGLAQRRAAPGDPERAERGAGELGRALSDAIDAGLDLLLHRGEDRVQPPLRGPLRLLGVDHEIDAVCEQRVEEGDDLRCAHTTASPACVAPGPPFATVTRIHPIRAPPHPWIGPPAAARRLLMHPLSGRKPAMRARTVIPMIALAACAGERQFPLKEPMWRDTDLVSRRATCHSDDDGKKICRPDEYDSSLAWDGADNVFFRPVSRFFAVDPGGEARNVNSLDEVPDSSWFENRIGRRGMTAEQ